MTDVGGDRPEMDAIEEIERIHTAAQAKRARQAEPAPVVSAPAAQAPAPAPAPAATSNGNGSGSGGVAQAPAPVPAPASSYQQAVSPPAISYQQAVPTEPIQYQAPEPLRPPSPLGELPPMSEMLGMGAPKIPMGYGAAPPPPVRDIRTLEDAYAVYPDIGAGLSFLRIERVEPKQYMGHNTAGWLGDLRQQISTSDFAMTYGGERYRISIMGPPRTRHNMPESGAAIRTLLTFEMRVPGPPQQEDVMQRYPNAPGAGAPFVFQAPGEDVRVQIAKLEMEERERQHARAMAEKNGLPMQEAVRSVRESTEHQARLMLEQAERRIEDGRHMYTAVVQQLRKLEEKNQELLEKTVSLQKELSEAKLYTETNQTRDLKERYETQIREIKEGFEREKKDLRERFETAEKELRNRYAEETQRRLEEHIKDKDRIVTEHRTMLETESRRHTEAMTSSSEALRHERDMARQTAKDQIDAHEKESQRTISNLKESYEGRISSLTEQTKRELVAMETRYKDQLDHERESHRRELDAEKSSATREYRSLGENREMLLQTTKATQASELQMLRTELDRERETRAGLEEENREMQAKLHKEVPEYLNEVTGIATMLGWEKKGEKDDGELSLTKILAKGTQGLIEKGPEMLREITAMRQNPGAVIQQQQLAHAQAQVHQQAQALAMERQRLASLPQGQHPSQAQAQGHRPGQNAAPPQWAQGQRQPGRPAPPPVSGQVGPRRQNAPPPVTGMRNVASASPVQPRASEAASVARPVAAEGFIAPPPAADVYVPPPPQPAQQAQPQPQQAPAGGAAGAPAGQEPISEAQLTEFYNQLATAIKTKYPTREFAERFVAEVGLEQTRHLVTHVEPDQLIAQLQQLADQHPQIMETDLSVILTVGGGRYIRDIFKHARALTEGAPPVGP